MIPHPDYSIKVSTLPFNVRNWILVSVIRPHTCSMTDQKASCPGVTTKRDLPHSYMDLWTGVLETRSTKEESSTVGECRSETALSGTLSLLGHECLGRIQDKW